MKCKDSNQIINDYLNFFEPDFIVEAEKGLADGHDFDKKRVFQLDDMLQYDLNDKEFKFKYNSPDKKSKIIYVESVEESFKKIIASLPSECLIYLNEMGIIKQLLQ
ncbi:hypothetical protein [Candidatus Tisiphia endosymbiont of Parasteatoda lunata]|uniref:hypothetical protein n=1 Tax=Candidatus Tisiphia endosymbiont of Parasteatoda lunata TaxID=3066275 RepID=UPI00313D1026